MKQVTITLTVHDDTNQNAVKDWVKSCPFSPEGGQTVTWQNLPDPLKGTEDDGKAQSKNTRGKKGRK